jgi:VanZ family protein
MCDQARTAQGQLTEAEGSNSGGGAECDEAALEGIVSLIHSIRVSLVIFFQRNPWNWTLVGWIGVIFLSSTSLAGEKSEQAFSYLSEVFLVRLRTATSFQGVVHLLADKSVHLGLFCVLGILLWKTLANAKRRIPVVLLQGAIIGSCSELIQGFFPGRDPAISDVLVNVVGTAIGIAISIAIAKVRTPTKKLVEA